MAEGLTKEYPIVYHNNGWSYIPEINKGYVYWEIIKRHVFKDSSLYHKFRRPDELDIVLSHNYKTKPIAEKCLEYLGISDYKVVGQDVDCWGHFTKLPIALDYITKHSKAEYILYLDSSDVILCNDPVLILRRFLRDFDCEVLFNAEKNSHPSSAETPLSDFEKSRKIEEFEYSTYESPFKYLNAGCYIGRRKSLVELFKAAYDLRSYFADPVFGDNDQGLIREVHRRVYPRIMIDHKCKIFQAMFLIKRNEILSKYPLSDSDVTLGCLKRAIRIQSIVTKKLLDKALRTAGKIKRIINEKRITGYFSR